MMGSPIASMLGSNGVMNNENNDQELSFNRSSAPRVIALDNNTVILQSSQPTVIVQAPPMVSSSNSVISRVYGTDTTSAFTSNTQKRPHESSVTSSQPEDLTQPDSSNGSIKRSRNENEFEEVNS